jgi:hypothetical protein
MDDPNDSVSPRPGLGARLLGLPIPSGSPIFFVEVTRKNLRVADQIISAANSR